MLFPEIIIIIYKKNILSWIVSLVLKYMIHGLHDTQKKKLWNKKIMEKRLLTSSA